MSYTLETDAPMPQWFLKPTYSMGQRKGSAGCFVWRFLLPSFPTHEAAIRWQLSGVPFTMPLSDRPTLTPPDILDLRVNARARMVDPQGATQAGPCVRFNSAIDGYELTQAGVVLTWHRSPEVICALLRAERWEPGYIKRVLASQDDPETALLDFDAREKRRRAHASQLAAIRAAEAIAEERRRHETLAKRDASGLSLDDILDG